jgi:hypothetical protein
MSLFQRTHKWKIRLGLIAVFYSLLSIYNQEQKIHRVCAVASSHACLSAHRTLKEALTGLAVGLALTLYGLIRRSMAKKKLSI